jgi:hypothetical protein
MLKTGDIVVVGEIGEAELDLLCAGFKARVMVIEGGQAFIDSDKAGIRQATSFSGWWPVSKLAPA